MKTFWKLLLIFCLIDTNSFAQHDPSIEFLSSFSLPNTSIRAIEVVDENTLWFAGSGGKYGRIVNEEIELDSIDHQGTRPNFRSIAHNGESIFLLSIEDPALLYKIDPSQELGNYQIVYQESNPKVFYDSMLFFDKNNGLAMGDPIENCLSVITTDNGGESWQKISCAELPNTISGEAAFAASNTNIAVIGKKAWIATGGSKARVFRSSDLGKTWQVTETPIAQGEKMTGIFTIDFYDKNKGIIMGGNWEDKKNTDASKAITANGGTSWHLIAKHELPGYISCVQYLPKERGEKIMAVSTEGMFYSHTSGASWNKIEEKGYYTIRFINNQMAWVATHEEISKIKLY